MELAYKVKYSKRKTLGITVERDRTIVVHAPKGIPEKSILKRVEGKKAWIFEKLKSEQKYQGNTLFREFVSGESIMYLGRNYRLEMSDNYFEGIKFQNKFLISKESKKNPSTLLKEWFRQRAAEKIPPKVDFFAKNMGVVFGRIGIRDLKYRWGSCTIKSNLNFNLKLITAPTYVIEYVIVHELAHLLETNHSKKFWNIVAIQIPFYHKAKRWLSDHGHLLDENLR